MKHTCTNDNLLFFHARAWLSSGYTQSILSLTRMSRSSSAAPGTAGDGGRGDAAGVVSGVVPTAPGVAPDTTGVDAGGALFVSLIPSHANTTTNRNQREEGKAREQKDTEHSGHKHEEHNQCQRQRLWWCTSTEGSLLGCNALLQCTEVRLLLTHSACLCAETRGVGA